MPLSPTERAEIRAAILAPPLGRNPAACCFLAEHVLGFTASRHFRTWIDWLLRFPRSMNIAKRGLGKSFAKQGIDVYRILCNPNVRMVTISKTDEAATELNAPVRNILESNDVLKQCFGEFVGRAKWADGGFTVAQRTDVMLGEPTLAARGIEAQLARTHWDHVWLDDAQDEDRAESLVLTERDWRWFFTTLQGTFRPHTTCNVNATPYTANDLVTRVEDWIDKRTGEARAQSYEIEDVWADGMPAPSGQWRILRTPAMLRDRSSIWPGHVVLDDVVLEDGTVIPGLLALEGAPGWETQQMARKPVKVRAGVRELIFKADSLRPWSEAPDLSRLRIAMFIDPSWVSSQKLKVRGAKKQRDPDYFAIAILGIDIATGRIYVLAVWQDQRLSLEDKLAVAGRFRETWRPARGFVAIERTNLQESLPEAREFYRRVATAVGMPVRLIAPQSNKKARAELGLARGCSRGEVEWDPKILLREDVREQLLRFGDPDLEHDDIVDALTGCYLLLARPGRSLRGYEQQADPVYETPTEDPRAVPREGGTRYLAGSDERAVPR